MIAFFVLFAASCGYLAMYAIHCFRLNRTLAAVGALLTAALPAACAAALIAAIA